MYKVIVKFITCSSFFNTGQRLNLRIMRKIFNSIILSASLLCLALSGCSAGQEVTISKDVLMDKIKGGWAAQTIGCTFGGPTEFRYRSRMIADSIRIGWYDDAVRNMMIHNKYLYDDVYMDLTFVEVFDRLGLDAPIDSFAVAYADAAYSLWHANQQARYNIHHGIMPPESGHWLNNPHADDIDFQIEADYAGLMSPGMTAAACHYADGIGHMMNYGDGWYGGVYVAAMYSLAFIYDDVETIVREALKVIPEGTRYRRCMDDVIRWWEENPSDWKATWQLIEDNYGVDVGCPEGVFKPYNIDAVINSAYILVGLLYGEADFEKTLEISTRCGQDSDCNPASAAGILATMQGYEAIPAKFLEPLKAAEQIPFFGTDIDLEKTYDMSYRQALAVIGKYGGKVGEDDVTICVRKPRPVRFEQGFEGLVPDCETSLDCDVDSVAFSFEGKGVVVRGGYVGPERKSMPEYRARIEVSVDGQVRDTVDFPASYHERLEQIWFDYRLESGAHEVRFKWLNRVEGLRLDAAAYIVYK